MGIEKKTLWKVPLFCVIGGIIVNYLSFHIILQMATVRLPDGGVTSNNTRVLIIYGALFLCTLLIGALVFRSMTRKEIFLSSSIVVIYGTILIVIQWAFSLNTGLGGIWMIYLFRPFEWCSFMSQIFFEISDNNWIGVAVAVLTPYLFVLFGKKQAIYNE